MAIVTAHEGSMEAFSAGANMGAEFLLRLPAAPQPVRNRTTTVSYAFAMVQHSQIRYSALVSLALALLMLVAPIGPHASGLILCLESDGSMSLEFLAGLDCAGEGDHDPHESPTVHASSDNGSHCESCVDVAIGFSADLDCSSFTLTVALDGPQVAVVETLTSESASASLRDLRSPARPKGAALVNAGLAPASLILLV
jgi:hypothetical protein